MDLVAQWSYEKIRGELAQLSPGARPEERRTLWIVRRAVGAARSASGAFEIFLAGPPLSCRSRLVRKHLEHNNWIVEEDGEEIAASRLVLPAAEPYPAVAALIVVELLRAGVGASRTVAEAFSDVEPLVELALRQGALPEEHLVGLFGELLVLEQLLTAIMDHGELRSAVLDMWQGHAQGSRDFSVGRMGIEVKTTRGEVSRHTISSLSQVEPRRLPSQDLEEIYLLSFGLTPALYDGLSLPMLVDRLLLLLGDPFAGPSAGHSALQSRFLRDVASYASSSGGGYDHVKMRTWAVYQDKFTTAFTPRLYDVQDPAIRILRSKDIAGSFVLAEGLTYRVELPPELSPSNPAPSWQAQTIVAVRSALGLVAL